MTEAALRQELERLTKTEKTMSLGELATRSGLARSHLSNFINEKRGISPERKTHLENAITQLGLERQDLPTLRERYREILTRRLRGLDLRFIFRGMPSVEMGSVPVVDVFVEHQYNRIQRGRILDELSCNSIEETSKDPVVHIYGKAGSGKTTAIRHKALELLEGQLQLPILLPMSVLNRMLHRSGVHVPPQEAGGSVNSDYREDLLALICKWYKDQQGVDLRPLFETALRNGNAWVMLDGFDEIADTDEYAAVQQFLNLFIDEYIVNGPPGNRITITERGASPFGESPIDQAVQYYIPEFDYPRRKVLIGKWVKFWASRQPDSTHNPEVLAEGILCEPFSILTGNPFYLTLMIVTSNCRNPEQVFSKPTASWVLNLFFDTISGLWNQLRSLDRQPSPVSSDLSLELTQTILSHIANKMVSIQETTDRDLTSFEAEQLAAEHYSDRFFLSPERSADYKRILDFTERFRDFTKDAGILAWPITVEGKVQFTHLLVRDWFAGLWLHHRIPELTTRVEDYIVQPMPYKQHRRDALTFALGAIESVYRNVDALLKIVNTALASAPFNDPRLKGVLPLGLDLCVHLLEHGRTFAGVEGHVLSELRSTFESTHYAVLTIDLHPRVQRLLDRAEWADEVPRSKERLEHWLNNLSNTDWTRKVDIIWRYQSRFDCLNLLFEAVEKRRSETALSQDDYEYLYRRLVFALRFVAAEDESRVVDRLEDILNKFEPSSVIWSMASYALNDLLERLRIEVGHALIIRVEKLLAKIAAQDKSIPALDATSATELIRRLCGYPIATVVKHATAVVRSAMSSLSMSADDIVHQFESVLRQPGPNKDKATAIVLLTSLFKTRDYGLFAADLYPSGRFSSVLESLVALSLDIDQHSTVDACQVYDFAAWALRSILLGRSTFDGAKDHLPPMSASI